MIIDHRPEITRIYAHIGFITLCALIIATLTSFIPQTIEYTNESSNSQIEHKMAEISAYSSTVDQTDDTPFITASNKKVRDGIVANNCLDFGTRVKIDNRVYIVEDRMNRRYGCEHFDIWMSDTDDALDWGRQKLLIEIQN